MNDLYFGDDVDQALVLFQLETDKAVRHKIFLEDIKPALDKLIQYHYYRIPIVRDETIMHDCLSFLYEILESGKFNTQKYTRGFPYFNMVVKNFFIQKIKSEKKKLSIDKNFESLNDTSEVNQNVSLIEENLEEKYENVEFLKIFKENMPKWREQFSKEQERNFIDALTQLFENAENIDIYNKKAIFFYLREMTNLNSKQIATNLNKIKKKFNFLKRKYQKGDV